MDSNFSILLLSIHNEATVQHTYQYYTGRKKILLLNVINDL